MSPDPSSNCGPYTPPGPSRSSVRSDIGEDNHDTIAMIAIDNNGDISSGTSTNGLHHKISGLVISSYLSLCYLGKHLFYEHY